MSGIRICWRASGLWLLRGFRGVVPLRGPPPPGNTVMSLSIVRKIYLMKVAFGWEGNFTA